jgi:hypothetical protein
MKAMERLKQRLEAIGATLDTQSEDGGVVYAAAPSGYIWRSSGTSVLAVDFACHRGTWSDIPGAMRDVYERMADGCDLVADGTPEGDASVEEFRYELGDADWGANVPKDAPKHITWPAK